MDWEIFMPINFH